MNHSSKGEIEAKLDRSLARQVRVPKLDRRFDAGVWARIEAEAGAQQVAAVRTARPAALASRWLFASNVVGYIVTALLVVYFGVRMFGSVDIEMPLPSMVSEANALTQPLVTWGFTIAALAVGLMLTPFGRRLRSEFS
jgi:hypothetical protein